MRFYYKNYCLVRHFFSCNCCGGINSIVTSAKYLDVLVEKFLPKQMKMTKSVCCQQDGVRAHRTRDIFELLAKHFQDWIFIFGLDSEMLIGHCWPILYVTHPQAVLNYSCLDWSITLLTKFLWTTFRSYTYINHFQYNLDSSRFWSFY